jgi:hypothetical protein
MWVQVDHTPSDHLSLSAIYRSKHTLHAHSIMRDEAFGTGEAMHDDSVISVMGER